MPVAVNDNTNMLKRRGTDSEEAAIQTKCSRLELLEDRSCARAADKPTSSKLAAEDHHVDDSPQDTAACASTSAAATAETEPDTGSSHPQDHSPPLNLLHTSLPATKRGTLVLDMDKTLIFKEWRLQPLDRRPQVVFQPDFHFSITYRGYPVQYHVKKRPFLDEFLQRAAALFDVVLFTASESIVTLPVVQQLDPENKLIHHLLCRGACTERGGMYVKDLARLGRDLSRTVIIDDNPDSFMWQPENAILVGEFSGWEIHDRELLRLLPVLDILAASHDMRAVVSALMGAPAPIEAAFGMGWQLPGLQLPAGVGAEAAVEEPQMAAATEDVQEEDSETSVVYL